MKSITVILTVHNRKDKTIKCLENLFSQTLSSEYDLSVYLTDDGCTDGTPEAVSKIFPQVHIVFGDGTLFWNRGMWTAWDAASKAKDYDYYLWLNDDTFLYEDCISSLVTASTIKNDKAIIVGACQWLDHNKGLSYGAFLNNKQRIVPNGSLQEAVTFNGNIVLIPRDVFLQVGNLDYYYRHSHGDTDYGFRAHALGIKIYQSGKYLGECDRHEKLPVWCNPDIPLKKRIKSLNLPTQYSPKEAFHYERKHYGIKTALFHQITIYLRLLFPTFWSKVLKAKS